MGRAEDLRRIQGARGRGWRGWRGSGPAGETVRGRAGLQHYKPLVDTMQGNVGDFKKVDSLPSFNLFTWFFVVPGILLVLLSGAGLFTGGALHMPAGKAHPAA